MQVGAIINPGPCWLWVSRSPRPRMLVVPRTTLPLQLVPLLIAVDRWHTQPCMACIWSRPSECWQSITSSVSSATEHPSTLTCTPVVRVPCALLPSVFCPLAFSPVIFAIFPPRAPRTEIFLSPALLLSPRHVSSPLTVRLLAVPLSNGSSQWGPNHVLHAQSSLGSPPHFYPEFVSVVLEGTTSEGLDFGWWEMNCARDCSSARFGRPVISRGFMLAVVAECT